MMHVPYEQKGNTVTINPRNPATRRQVTVDEFRAMASGAMGLNINDVVLYKGAPETIEHIQSFDSVKLLSGCYVSPTKLNKLPVFREPSGRNTAYDTTTEEMAPLTVAVLISAVIIAVAYGVAYLLGV